MQRMSTRASSPLLLATSVATLALAACGSDDEATPTDAGLTLDLGVGDAGAAGSDVGTTDGGATAADAGSDAGVLPDAGNTMTQCVATPGTITRPASCPSSAGYYQYIESTVTIAGAGEEGASAQVCVTPNEGGLACLPPVGTCMDGTWFLELAEEYRCMDRMVLNVGKSSRNGGQVYASTFCLLPLTGEGVLRSESSIELYPVDPDTSKPALGDPETARTLDLQDGVQITMTPSEIVGCYAIVPDSCSMYDDFGVRKLTSSDATPCFVDSANPPDAIYATSLAYDVDGEGWDVRMDNTENLAPGTTVDMYVLGAIECHLANGTEIVEGEWTKSGTAQVSSDGQYIEGGKLPCVSWFGYKAQ